ncbi:MAG: hypothetical protein HRF45_09985 [Fimbriimonadia bacterium]|jgi:hypothetical protein
MSKKTRAVGSLLGIFALLAMLAGCTAEPAQTGEGENGKQSTAKTEPKADDIQPKSDVVATAEPADPGTVTEPAVEKATEDPAKVGPWDLRVRFKKGEAHTYSIKSDSSVSVKMGEGDPMPPQQMTDEATISVKALEASDKSAKVEYKVTPKKKGAEAEKPTTLVVSVDSKGNSKAEGESKDPRDRMLASLPLAAIHCPDKPVKLNDKWTASIQHPLKAFPQLAMMGLKVADTMKIAYQVVGVTDKGLKVRATAGDKLTLDVKEGTAGTPGPGHVDISLQFTMDYIVDPKTAQVLSASIVQASKSNVEQTMGEGKKVKQSSDSKTKITLNRTK